MSKKNLCKDIEFLTQVTKLFNLRILAIYGIGSQYFGNPMKDSDTDYLIITPGKTNFGYSKENHKRKIDILFIGKEVVMDFIQSAGSNFLDFGLINCIGLIYSCPILFEVSNQGQKLKAAINKFIQSRDFQNVLQAMRHRVDIIIKKAKKLNLRGENMAALFCLQYAFWDALYIYLAKENLFFRGPYQSWLISKKHKSVNNFIKRYLKVIDDSNSLVVLLQSIICHEQ